MLTEFVGVLDNPQTPPYLTLQAYRFNPLKNQNYPPFFWYSSSVSSFRLPYTGLILPCLLEPKELYSKWAKSDPKIVVYFTHRNGPIFGSKTDLFDLQCIINTISFRVIHTHDHSPPLPGE